MKAIQKKYSGKGYNTRLRKEKKIPAIIYGNGCKNEMVIVDDIEFGKIFRSARERSIIEIDIEGTKKNVLIRDYQIDPVKRNFTHVDFYEIMEGNPVKTKVPIILENTPVGVRMGGVLEQYIIEIDIKCLPKNLPESILVDVTSLDVKQGILVRDLKVPEGIEILLKPDINVARVVPSRKTKEEAATTGGATEEATEEATD